MVRTTCEILQFRKSKTLKFHRNFDENKLQLCEQLINVLDGIFMENQGVRFENELRNRTLVWKALKERARLICQNLDATIVVNWVILLGTAQNHVKTLILLEKMSKTGNSPN